MFVLYYFVFVAHSFVSFKVRHVCFGIVIVSLNAKCFSLFHVHT